MKRMRFTEEQIIGVLREQKAGAKSAAQAALLTATGDRLRYSDQLRRSPLAPTAPDGVSTRQALIAAGLEFGGRSKPKRLHQSREKKLAMAHNHFSKPLLPPSPTPHIHASSNTIVGTKGMADSRNAGVAGSVSEEADPNVEWSTASYVSIDLAMIWIARRSDQSIASYLRSADRAAHLERSDKMDQPRGLKKKSPIPARPMGRTKASPQKPNPAELDGMTSSLSAAATKMENDFTRGLLQVRGKNPSGDTVDVPTKMFDIERFVVNEGENRIEDLASNRATFVDLRVAKSALIKRYPTRDTFAARRFRRPIWNAYMAAYWINERRVEGFFDDPWPGIAARQFDKLFEALQKDQLNAVIAGKATAPGVWFEENSEELLKAAFENEKVVNAFPREENRNSRQAVENLIATLPADMADTDVIKRVREEHEVSAAFVSKLLVNDHRFKRRARGRPPGSKNVKGKSSE